MKKFHLLFLSVLMSVAIFLTACENFASNETLLDVGANLVIKKYENASCAEVAKMQPQSKSAQSSPTEGGKDAGLQAKALEMLQKNPEMRQLFINRVAGPIANKMFECNLIP